MTTFPDWLAQLGVVRKDLDATTRMALLHWYSVGMSPQEAFNACRVVCDEST